MRLPKNLFVTRSMRSPKTSRGHRRAPKRPPANPPSSGPAAVTIPHSRDDRAIPREDPAPRTHPPYQSGAGGSWVRRERKRPSDRAGHQHPGRQAPALHRRLPSSLPFGFPAMQYRTDPLRTATPSRNTPDRLTALRLFPRHCPLRRVFIPKLAPHQVRSASSKSVPKPLRKSRLRSTLTRPLRVIGSVILNLMVFDLCCTPNRHPAERVRTSLAFEPEEAIGSPPTPELPNVGGSGLLFRGWCHLAFSRGRA